MVGADPQASAHRVTRTCTESPLAGTWVPPGWRRRRRTGCARLEPSPANQLSVKRFWLCKNGPRGSGMTFTPGGKLIAGAWLVGCSLPQGNQ